MGIFDRFREDNSYEGNHNANTQREEFRAEDFRSKSEIISWLTNNKIIVLAEKGGVVVYTNPKKENFITGFTAPSKVVDKELDEYAELGIEDLKSLFSDLKNVNYLLLNPKTDDIRLDEAELVKKREKIDEPSAFPSRRNRHESSTSDPRRAPSHSAGSISIARPRSANPIGGGLSKAPRNQATRQNPPIPQANTVPSSPKIAPSKTVSDLTGIRFLPRQIIELILTQDQTAIHSIYAATGLDAQKLHYYVLIDSDQELKFEDKLPRGLTFVSKTDASLTSKLKNEDFLIYDQKEITPLGKKPSARELYSYVQKHKVIYAKSYNFNDAGEKQLFAFTDFKAIPKAFLRSFDRFEISNFSAFSALLSAVEDLEYVKVNPFTDNWEINPVELVDFDENRKNVFIVGLGLIGSSIALNFAGDEHIRVSGYDKEDVLALAKEKGLIDLPAKDFESVAEGADVIILATPVEKTLNYLDKLSTLNLKEGVIITDTASTKTDVMRTAQKNFAKKEVTFIGGHPMTGSHKSGILAANIHLFENAYYILTEKNQALESLLSPLNAKFVVMDAASHDQATGQVSHFPHLLASVLVKQAKDYSEEIPMTKKLAAGGFRDITRVADSDSKLWSEILLSNKKELLSRIEDFKTHLSQAEKLIEAAEVDKLEDFLEESKVAREEMIIQEEKLPGIYDLFVSVPDKKGAVLGVLNLLQDFSIVNLALREENREEINGVLQISFSSEKENDEAMKLLKAKTKYMISK